MKIHNKDVSHLQKINRHLYFIEFLQSSKYLNAGHFI